MIGSKPAIEAIGLGRDYGSTCALDTLDRAAAPLDSGLVGAHAPVIGRYFAARLRVLGDRRPPVAQVAVTMRGHTRDALVAYRTVLV